MVGGSEVTQNNSTWKLSRPHITANDPHLWSGHMGFLRDGDISTWAWDDETGEFLRGEADSGVVVPILIDIEQQLVSFQLITNQVRMHTVTTNLQALLNQHGTHKWTVEPYPSERTYEE